jgi:hypothetical protein
VIALPSFRGVPYVSRIERDCRLAAEEPKSSEDGRKNRKRWNRRIARLLRPDDDADWKVVADYLKGKFDRKPAQGRPENYEQAYTLWFLAERVEAIRRERGCSRDAALWTFMTENPFKALVIENGVERWVRSDDDPDEGLFSYLRNYLKR